MLIWILISLCKTQCLTNDRYFSFHSHLQTHMGTHTQGHSWLDTLRHTTPVHTSIKGNKNVPWSLSYDPVANRGIKKPGIPGKGNIKIIWPSMWIIKFHTPHPLWVLHPSTNRLQIISVWFAFPMGFEWNWRRNPHKMISTSHLNRYI